MQHPDWSTVLDLETRDGDLFSTCSPRRIKPFPENLNRLQRLQGDTTPKLMTISYFLWGNVLVFNVTYNQKILAAYYLITFPSLLLNNGDLEPTDEAVL